MVLLRVLQHRDRGNQSSMADAIALVGYFVLTLMLLWTPASNAFIIHTSNYQRLAPRQIWSLQAEKLTSEEVRTRLEQEMQRLREKDRTSLALKPEELNIVYEDEHIVVVDKPSGVLTTANAEEFPSLAKTAFERLQQQRSGSTNNNEDTVAKMDQMVVHRLGMDTSGLVVFTKTMEALREINTLFRTRKVTRQYEALVCGHITDNEGLISLPLMRDYEHPPYMRVSTDDQQRHLLTLDPDIVGRKLLEAPKAATTHYQVLSRECLNDNDDLPVTRVTLTSVSGRTHQLNVHCAASGHPIVQDTVYGWQGRAASYGGLKDELPAGTKCPDEVQAAIAQATKGQNMCVHSKLIRFRHPVKTEETVEFTSEAPF